MSQHTVLPVDERPEPPESAASRRPLAWGWIIFGTALTLGLLMAFVVFRFQSLVDTDIDPYWFGKIGGEPGQGHGFAGTGRSFTRRVPALPAR